MTENQVTYLEMVDADLLFLSKFIALWGTNVKISDVVDAITAERDAIKDEAEVQSTDITGATDNQKILWLDAGKKALHVCTGGKAYFLDIEDEAKFKEINFTMTSFMKCKKVDAVTRMNLVHTKVGLIPIASLGVFNVTAGDMTGLRTAVDLFNNAQPVKREKVVEKSVVTSNIATRFANLRKYYKKLDVYIDTMKVSQPAFVEGYHKSREIINLGKGHKTVEFRLGPEECGTAFENEFEAGYSFIVRNHSQVSAFAGLSSSTNGAPESTVVEILANRDLVLVIPNDAIGMLTRYLSIQNKSKLYDLNITIIMTKEVSHSSAEKVILTGIPK